MRFDPPRCVERLGLVSSSLGEVGVQTVVQLFGVEPEDPVQGRCFDLGEVAPRALGVDQLGLATLTVLGTAFAAQALPGEIRKLGPSVAYIPEARG
jgi:hypothetical protein